MVIEDPVIFAIALNARDAQFLRALHAFDQPLFDARDWPLRHPNLPSRKPCEINVPIMLSQLGTELKASSVWSQHLLDRIEDRSGLAPLSRRYGCTRRT